MADRSTTLIVAALSRAAAGEAPLHKTRQQAGLFPGSAAGRQAARQCQDEGYLASAADAPGRWVLTEKGFHFLLSQASPRDILQQLVDALQSRDGQLVDLLTVAGQMRLQMAALRAGAEQVLQQLTPPDNGDGAGPFNALFRKFVRQADQSLDNLCPRIVEHLHRWSASNALEDCPLPALYQHAATLAEGLTIGRFHDALRQLHETARCYLHPWTGPLHEIPEPSYALLVGHEIAYYASPRSC